MNQQSSTATARSEEEWCLCVEKVEDEFFQF